MAADEAKRGALLDATLAHLRALVAFDTRNPPRAITTGDIFDYVRQQLPGFDVRITDYGAGAVSLYATRGQPKLLFNVHLDTVPDSPQWSADPLALRVTDGRAVGLGACDIKGAAAALLAAAAASDGGAAFLFTTDEEGADPRCVRAFLHEFSGKAASFQAVIVAEPTGCRAVTAHRGILSFRGRFAGRAGHASRAQAPPDSAVHQAMRWGAAALDWAQARASQRFGALQGLRFNIGRIEGGIKANMIASRAEVVAGMRPLPSMDMDALFAQLRSLTDAAPVAWDETFRGPPLPADTAHAGEREHAAAALAAALGIEQGAAVDFWTEAALFSQAGYTTFVYGPGDIAQAHAAGEWVALDQLATAALTYQHILEMQA